MGAKEKRHHRRFNYFDAFEEQAGLACKEAKLLIDIIENFENSEGVLPDVKRAHEIEHAGDAVCHDLFAAVTVDFVTPIDREDIIAMAQSLDDVLDYMEGTIQRFYMLNISGMHPEALGFAKLLLKSCEALKKAMGDFRNFKNSKKLKRLIMDVNDVEEEADDLFFRVMRELYTEHRDDPVEVFVWDKLFQRLENTADACEKVADTMGSIVMKNA